MRANSRVTQFKKELILQTALDLFSRNCFETVTVEDIAREAGFGKATIYTFFVSKEEILTTIIRTGLEKLCTEIQDIIFKSPDTLTALDRVISLHFSKYQEFDSLIVSYIRRKESGAIETEWVNAIIQLHKKRIDLIAAILEDGLKSNVLLSATKPHDLALVLDGIIRGVCLQSMHLNIANIDRDMDIMKTIVFNGIKNNK